MGDERDRVPFDGHCLRLPGQQLQGVARGLDRLRRGVLHVVEARTAGQVEPGHRHDVPVHCFGQLRDPVLRRGPFCPLFQGPNNFPGRNHRFALWFDLGVHQRLLDGFPLLQELFVFVYVEHAEFNGEPL